MSKNIIVTGCSRGVGLEICRVLLDNATTYMVLLVAIPMNSRLWKQSALITSSSRVLTLLIVKTYAIMSSKTFVATRYRLTVM